MSTDIVGFIRSNRALLDLILDLVPIPLFVKDKDGRYIDCNVAFKNFLAVSREQIIGRTVHQIWSQDEADVFFAQDRELLDRGGLQVYESKITSSEGVIHIVQFHKQTFTDASGEIAGFLGAIFDITEKKGLECALARLAATDELTGLPNRREGMTRLEILHKTCRTKDRPYCVAMVDIDHFKRVNDEHGHASGDIVLKAFSELAKRTLRSGDVCFRYGGEEFVILLPEAGLDEGIKVVERLRQAWSETAIALPAGKTVQTTVSIGIVQHPMRAISFDSLIQESDRALYSAKSGGRNQTVCIPHYC